MRALRAIGLASWLLLAPAGAIAQDGHQNQDPQSSRAQSFQAVEGPTREDVPGGPLLIGAYAAAWLFVLAYVARLGLLYSKTARELDRLESVLKKGTAPGGESPEP